MFKSSAMASSPAGVSTTPSKLFKNVEVIEESNSSNGSEYQTSRKQNSHAHTMTPKAEKQASFNLSKMKKKKDRVISKEK